MTVIDLEARKNLRQRGLDSGLIRFGELSVCCVLHNLSETVAALDVDTDCLIPDRFALIVVRKKKTYPSAVIWRKGRRVDVSFC